MPHTNHGRTGVQGFIDALPLSGYHFQIFALCVLGLLFDGFDVQSMGLVAPALRGELGLSPAALGPVFSASLFGMLVGALLFGSAADRIGRRRVLVAALTLCGVAMCVCANIHTVRELMAVRFVTGLGLGTLLPTSLTVTSEFSPARSRATIVMLMSIGFVAGAALGGLLAAHLIPLLGWRSVFWAAGVGSLCAAVVTLLWLPESMQFAVESSAGGSLPQLMKTARRLSRNPALPDQLWFSEKLAGSQAAKPDRSVMQPFRGGYAITTLLLWLLNFANLLDVYLLSSWLPTLLSEAKLPMHDAVIAGTVLQSGGVPATILLSLLSKRIRVTWVMFFNCMIGTVAMATIGFAVGSSLSLLFLAIFFAGFCVVGGQSGINALGAHYYPTSMRAAGMGWANGIGRFGSVAGPLFGGLFLTLGWGGQSVFFGAAGSGVIATLAVLLLHLRAAPATQGARLDMAIESSH